MLNLNLQEKLKEIEESFEKKDIWLISKVKLIGYRQYQYYIIVTVKNPITFLLSNHGNFYYNTIHEMIQEKERLEELNYQIL